MKRFFSLLLIAMLVLFICPTIGIADNVRQSGAFFYRIKGNGTAVITGYDWDNHQNEDIYIPRMLDGYTVTEIGEEAFARLEYDENMVITDKHTSGSAKSLVIPDTVRSIGEKAFMNVDFESFSITIPYSVEYIGAGAFAGLGGVKQFVVDTNNPIYATIDGVLYHKQQKLLVACPSEFFSGSKQELIIPEGIISIGDYAFWDISLYAKKLTLPTTLRQIGNYAFARTYDYCIDTKYGKIVGAPDALETIGEGAFYKAQNYQHNYIDFSNTRITEIPALAFYGIEIFYDIKLPDTVQSIGERAFENVKLKSRIGDVNLILPAALKSIGVRAFAYLDCPNEKLSISFSEPSMLRSISDSAFLNSGLDEIILPEGLESIDDNAFGGCKDLKKLNLPSSVRTIGENICDKTYVGIDVVPGSYAALWASENGYITQQAGQEDTSWLN